MAVAVFAQRRDVNRIVRGGNSQFDPGEFKAVEPDQTRAGARPEKTVLCLDDRRHRVGLETIRVVPNAHGAGGFRQIKTGTIGPIQKEHKPCQAANQTDMIFLRQGMDYSKRYTLHVKRSMWLRPVSEVNPRPSPGCKNASSTKG